MMECSNELGRLKKLPVSSVVTLLQLLNPFAPHITEELYSELRKSFSDLPDTDLANQDWPEHDESFLIEDEVEIVVQVNGKVRDRMMIRNDASKEEVEECALQREKVQGFIEGNTVRKVIVVPGRLVNIVAN